MTMGEEYFALGRMTPLLTLSGACLQLLTLRISKPTPHAETFVMTQRIFEALGSDFATKTDLFRFARRSTLFGIERFGIGLGAQRTRLPFSSSAPRLAGWRCGGT